MINFQRIKQAGFLLIIIWFLAFVYGQGHAKDVSMKTIENALMKNREVAALSISSPRQLSQFIRINANEYEGVFYAKAKGNMDVSEVLVVKAKNKDQINSIKDAVEERIERQINDFQGYGLQQVAMMKNAKIYTQGDYLFYCVANHPDRISKEFKNVI